MQRPLSLCGVGLLVLVLTAGLTFANSQAPSRPLTTAAEQSSPSSFASFKGGNKGGNKKFVSKKKKPGKAKPGKKTGNKKKNKKKHHKKHHHKKHHKKHKKDKDDMGGGDEGGGGEGGGESGGGDEGGGGEGGGDMGGGDSGGGDSGGSGSENAVEPELRTGHGLLITDLDENGPAANAGLDVDDTILKVNGVRVQSVEELRAVVEAAKGPVVVVYISDETGDMEEAQMTPQKGRLGITMDVVTVDDAE
jgi:hypothetical protein